MIIYTMVVINQSTDNPNEDYIVAALLPEEESEYYQQLRRKHFSQQAVGSRFTDDTLETLLQRNPQLIDASDDRQKFLDLGVSEQALLPDRSYFLLRAPGEEGLIAADNLSAETPVTIIAAKSETLSFTVTGHLRPRTTIATAIVGDYPADPRRRALITIFPGLPADPGRSALPADNDLGIKDGQIMALDELQRLVGRDDLLLQIA